MYLRFLMPIICFTFPFLLISQKPNDVLLNVGTTPVTVNEFRYIYEKNNGAAADYSEKNLNEYLELYTKFKLKVEKARDMKLDTISELKTELAGYRKQLAASYLIDKEVTDELLKELYERMKTDIEFSHIFIPVAENASYQTTEEARVKLKDIQIKLQKGQDFAKVATEFSEDKNSASTGGYMGYFTAKMPTGFYNLESALYQTPIGSIPDIVESKIGLHLIKVSNKRPARGQVEVAHLLLKADQKSIADSLYNLIKSGANFEDLVSRYSTDKNSSRNKGLLPPFGINTYDKNFEDAAFNLKSDGDVSEPVLTRSGWHIIRRIAKPSPDSYEIFVKKMKAQINKDQRFDVAKFKLISDIKKSGGFVAYPEKLKAFAAGLNEEFYSYRWNQEIQNPNDVLFDFGNKKSYTLNDFAEYCKKIPVPS
ncbi:MAG: peptidylprolyl isomerase [Saprospiraceae bacterium]|nr:peptidylprolyl isomerase [Saprospiraceae bacterium]